MTEVQFKIQENAKKSVDIFCLDHHIYTFYFENIPPSIGLSLKEKVRALLRVNTEL